MRLGLNLVQIQCNKPSLTSPEKICQIGLKNVDLFKVLIDTIAL